VESNWAWGLSLTALTIVIHSIGVTFLALVLRWIADLLATRDRLRSQSLFALLIGLLGVVGLLLAVLHGLEAGLWASAYVWLGALASPAEAILYSIDSISKRGASGLTVEHGWRVMGALEAMDGMLLFGISTAFIFAVMQVGLQRLAGRSWPSGVGRADDRPPASR
jgi:hypothetical protein